MERFVGGITKKFKHGSDSAPFVVEGYGRDLGQHLVEMI
jgi:hypothetical protein